MPGILLYFQAHQPCRLRNLSFFDFGNNPEIEDKELNKKCLFQAADNVYKPTIDLLSSLNKKHKNYFSYSLLLSGTLIQQIESTHPELLFSFQELLNTDSVEFLGETFHHSLAGLFSAPEFEAQVMQHKIKIEDIFKKKPILFRNTNLLYSSEMILKLKELGFKGLITTNHNGLDEIVRDKPVPHSGLYNISQISDFATYMRNHIRDEDSPRRLIQKFINEISVSPPETICIGVNIDNLGADSGSILYMLHYLKLFVTGIIRTEGFYFIKPSDILGKKGSVGFHENTVINKFEGNIMQKEALRNLYLIEKEVKTTSSPHIIKQWRALQSFNHIGWLEQQDISEYETPLESPYHEPHEAYMNLMNAISMIEIYSKSINSSVS